MSHRSRTDFDEDPSEDPSDLAGDSTDRWITPAFSASPAFSAVGDTAGLSRPKRRSRSRSRSRSQCQSHSISQASARSDELRQATARMRELEQRMLQAVRDSQDFWRERDEARGAARQLSEELSQQRELRAQAEHALGVAQASLTVTGTHRQQMEAAHMHETRATLAQLEDMIA